MKKIFTLIAAAIMAVSVSAQGTYQFESSDAIKAGTTVDAVPNCTLTFGAEGGADFKAVKANESVEGFTGFTEGHGQNGTFADGVAGGTFYELKPAQSGVITVAVVLNANKAFFVYEDGTALADFDGIKKDEKFYGTFTFNVVGGKTYDVLCTGSKLGFYGFTYEVTGGPVTGISNIATDENAPVEYYNLQGVRVANPANGIFFKRQGNKVEKVIVK